MLFPSASFYISSKSELQVQVLEGLRQDNVVRVEPMVYMLVAHVDVGIQTQRRAILHFAFGVISLVVQMRRIG